MQVTMSSWGDDVFGCLTILLVLVVVVVLLLLFG